MRALFLRSRLIISRGMLYTVAPGYMNGLYNPEFITYFAEHRPDYTMKCFRNGYWYQVAPKKIMEKHNMGQAQNATNIANSLEYGADEKTFNPPRAGFKTGRKEADGRQDVIDKVKNWYTDMAFA